MSISQERKQDRMQTNNEKIMYLDDADDLKVREDDPDVRGWSIYTKDKKKLGKVENMIIDRDAMRVRYLDVHMDDNLLQAEKREKIEGTGENPDVPITEDGYRHMAVPVGMVKLDTDDKQVIVNEDSRNLLRTPRYNKEQGITSNYEIEVREVLVCPLINEEPGRYNKEEHREKTLDSDFYDNKYYRSAGNKNS